MDTAVDTGLVEFSLVLFSCHLTLIQLSLYHKLTRCSHVLFQGTSDTTHREGPASAAIVQNQQTSTHRLVTSNHSNWTGRTAIMLFPDSCSSIIPWNCQVISIANTQPIAEHLSTRQLIVTFPYYNYYIIFNCGGRWARAGRNTTWSVHMYAHYIVVWIYNGVGLADPTRWGLCTLWSQSWPCPIMLECESANKKSLPQKRAEWSMLFQRRLAIFNFAQLGTTSHNFQLNFGQPHFKWHFLLLPQQTMPTNMNCVHARGIDTAHAYS